MTVNVLVQDTFTRANTTANTNIATGWGTSSDGNTWSNTGATAASWSILSNQGKVTGAASDAFALLSANTYGASEGLIRLSTSSISGSNWEGLFLRYTSTTVFYAAYIEGGNTLRIVKGSTVLTSVAITYSANTEYWLRFRAQGSNLYARFWADGSSEPTTWTLTTTDSTTATGRVGIYTSPDVAATTTVFDNFSVNDATLGSTTLAGSGVLSATLQRSTALSTTLAGSGVLAETISLSTALTTTLAGAGTLSGTLTAQASGAALSATIAGIGATTATFSLATNISSELDGIGTLTPALTASFSLSGATLAGTTALSGGVTLSTAFLATVIGAGTLSGAPTYALALTRTLAGTGSLAGSLSASNVYFANPGDNLQTKASALVAGDTLILNDGTYSTSPGLSIAGIHGTALAPITIKAANDGQAIIDGGGTFAPIFMTNCSYVTLQGLRAQNSSSNVVYLFSSTGSGNGPLDHITLQRITAHGSGTQNSHVFSIAQTTSQAPPSALTNILVEDCAAWGPGRYMFTTYHSDTVIFRRCFAYWNTITDTLQEPRAPFNVYGAKNVTLENCVGIHCNPYQTEAFNNSFTACWHTSDDTVNYPCDNTKVYGCVFYNNWEGWWLNDSAGTNALFQDCYFETPANAATWTTQAKGDGFSANSGYIGTAIIRNCTFRNSVVGFIKRTASDASTLTIQSNSFNGNATGMSNDPGHSYCGFFGNTANGTTTVGTDKTSDPLYDTTTYGKGGALFVAASSPYKGAGAGGSDIGANILYQYVNGVLTTTPLWPWPMEARILAELGQSPTYASNGGPWITLTGIYSIPGTSIVYIPRALSALLVLTVTALTDQLSGVSTLGGALSLSTDLTATLSGTGALSGPLAATLPLSGTNLVGVSTLASTLSLTRYLVSTLDGAGTLTGSGQLTTALAGTLAGAGQFSGALTTIAGAALVVTIAGAGTSAGTVQLATSLGTMLAGGTTLTGTLAAALPLASMTCAGTGTLAGTPGLTTALFTTYAGVGTLSGPLSANIQLASITTAGSGTLAGTVALGTALVNTLSGTGQLSGAISAAFTVAGTMAGVGTLAGTAGLRTALADTLSGTGALAGTAPALKTSLTSTCAGVGTLTGAISGGGALATTVAGTSSLSSTLSLSTALAGSLAGAGTLAAPLSARMALSGILSGTGSSAGTLSLLAAYQATLAGTSTLSGVSVRASYLLVTLPGSSGLSGTTTRVTLLSCVYTGVGQFSPSLVIGGALTSCLFTGIGQLAGALTFPGPSALATWKTRDMKATWVARDDEATWVARDDEATWKTRR